MIKAYWSIRSHMTFSNGAYILSENTILTNPCFPKFTNLAMQLYVKRTIWDFIKIYQCFRKFIKFKGCIGFKNIQPSRF